MAQFLRHGVTTVRDMGSPLMAGLSARSAVKTGRLVGPRVTTCGRVLDGPDSTLPFSRRVETPEEARAAVGDLAARGVECIKVYSRLPLEALEAIASAAQDLGLPVIGHLPLEGEPGETRIGEIQHLCGPHCAEFSPAEYAELAQTAVRDSVAHTPTLLVYARQLQWLAGHEPEIGAAAAHLAPLWRSFLWNPDVGITADRRPVAMRESFLEDRRYVLAQIRATVRRLYDLGGTLRVGSDTPNAFVPPGRGLHDEMRELVAAGVPTEAVWERATIGAGRALGQPELGRLSPGAPADLLVFGDDPTRDLEALDSLEAVVVRGRLYTVEELDALIVRQGAVFRRPLQRALQTLAGWVLALGT